MELMLLLYARWQEYIWSGFSSNSVLISFFCLQDYGKESQAKDVIEEYFKSKKWGVNKVLEMHLSHVFFEFLKLHIVTFIARSSPVQES